LPGILSTVASQLDGAQATRSHYVVTPSGNIEGSAVY